MLASKIINLLTLKVTLLFFDLMLSHLYSGAEYFKEKYYI
jgi:hypothetical protein